MITDCKVTSVFTNVNWTTNVGSSVDADMVAALQAEGSGAYIANFDGFNGASDYLLDTSAITPGATINSVTLVANARQDAGSSVPAEFDVLFQAAPGNESALFTLSGAYAEYGFAYSHPITLAQLATAILGVGEGSLEGKSNVDYLVARVDWNAPSISDATYLLQSASDVNLSAQDGSAYALSSGMTIDPFIPVGPVGVVIGATAYVLNPGGIRIAEPLQQIAGFFVPPFAVHRRKRLKLF